MNKKIDLDLGILRVIYTHYKKLIIPSLVIFISLLLFIKFVVPQIQDLLTVRQEIQVEYDKLNILKNNLTALTNLNDSALDKQLQILTKALPVEKDFNSILDALSIASVKAGVSLGNYSFKVGDLSTIKDHPGKYLFLKLDINVNGEVISVNNFINTLSNTLPLSQITSLEMNGKDSTITVTFYYKPLPPIEYDDKLPLVLVSKKDLDLLKKLSSFNNL